MSVDLISSIVAIKNLYATGRYVMLDKNVEENEHSLEMHLPFIYKVMEGYALWFPLSLSPLLLSSSPLLATTYSRDVCGMCGCVCVYWVRGL
jgi:predicted class III extradiol MEMO1 family dioxygenase